MLIIIHEITEVLIILLQVSFFHHMVIFSAFLAVLG